MGIGATQASAHTPNWTVSCSTVTVDLTAYNSGVTNTVTITADGKDLLPIETFGREFHKTLDLPSHSSDLAVRLVVKAGDGERYSKDDTKTSPVCEGSTPSTTAPATAPVASPPTEAPTTPATPTEAQTPSSAPSSSAPAVPASPSSSPSSNLAETGASSATPAIAGTAAAVVVIGGALLFVARKRSAARH
jgi:LPXTG-motif cell wall-anchored protein